MTKKSSRPKGRPPAELSRPRGRPPAALNAKEIRGLAAIHCTQAEVAAFYGVALTTIEGRFQRDPELREAWEQGRALGCISLRRMQARMAEAGNITMLIWLGKQYLGQKDKTEHSGIGAGGEILLTLADLDAIVATATES